MGSRVCVDTMSTKCIKQGNDRATDLQNKQEIETKRRLKIMLEKIQELVAEGLGVDIEQVMPTSRFKEDLGADSLDLFELVMSFEDEFGVEIESDELEKMSTVQDVMTYIEAHK